VNALLSRLGRRTRFAQIFPFRLSLVCAVSLTASAQGPLTPPGPPGPVYKTLQQVEPRVDVQTLPGNDEALFIISQPGSYYLSGNITGVAGKSGIGIRSSDVVLDLNGFALLGVPDPFSGIEAGSRRLPYTNIVVRNGTVSGWGGVGVDIGLGKANVLVEHLQVQTNSTGISISGEIRNCRAYGNAFSGLIGSRILNCIANSNGGIGISGNEIIACTANSNGGSGIAASSGGFHAAGVVRDCEASLNGDAGIFAVSNSLLVTGNHLVFNNVNASPNYGEIASGGSNSRFENNHLEFGDGSAGIRIYDFALRNVIIRNSTVGIPAANGYLIPAGNDVGPIGTAATATSPWANIQN